MTSTLRDSARAKRRRARKALALLAFMAGIAAGTGLYVGLDGYFAKVSISFTAPSSGTVGDSATLSATASSGLPVVFSVDPASGAGVCAISGAVVSYAAAGSCVIDANQAGDSTYAATPPVQQTIAVTLKPQSITFPSPPASIVGNLVALLATASSRLPVVFSIDPASGAGVCTLYGSAVSYATAGSCIIDANQAGNSTYAAAPPVQQTIAVQVG